jgi:hypothetical protein
MNRSIILALSLAAALLAATASTASADRELHIWCAPLPAGPPPPPGPLPENACIGVQDPATGWSFDFGDRQVGTTSPAQGFAFGVLRDDSFNPRISVSGDFAQTNNCPPTLSAAGEQIAGCVIGVTFDPTGTGPRHGTLSTGPGGPTVALTGTGVTTPTPWDWPLTLNAFVDNQQTLGRRGVVKDIIAWTEIGLCLPLVPQCPDYETKLVLRGDVKKTTKQLTANDPYKEMNARLKHLKQLRAEPTAPKIKIKAVATDEFGQTATEVLKVKLCSRQVRVPEQDPGFGKECVWHPSRK